MSSSTLAVALPSGFTKTKVATVNKPTAMAFAPDGRLFVTERGTTSGGTARIRIIKNGSLLSTPFVSFQVDNTSVSPNERGLLGIAIDPNFATNKFVYVYYTAPTSPPHNRVSRFTANGDVAVSGSEKQLLNLDNLNAGNHNGGPLLFGKDGKLYVGVGENANSSNSTNLGNHLGKILRINSDGTVPSDNPFFNSGDGINARDRIWAFGLRNPFTMGVQPGTGRIFVNDVGQSSWEEINDLVKQKDYGWRGGSTDGDSTAWFKYSSSVGKCIAGGTFYNPPSAPGTFSSFVGRYFFGDYQAGFIKAINPSDKSVTTFDTGVSGIVDIDVGPDGSLYFARTTTGEIFKISTTATISQAIVLSDTDLTVNEAQSGSFTVRLAKQPSSNITVNVAKTSGDASITPSVSSLTFTSSNWSTAQTVRVNAADDTDNITDSARITCSASGLSSKHVVVNAVDNDTSVHALLSAPREADVVKGTGAEFYGGSNFDGSAQKGQFFIDGVLKYTDNGAGHYHFGGSHAIWDTTKVKEGVRTLRLTVSTASASGSHELRVTVDNLPSPWNHEDVGAVSASGSASASSGTFTVKGSGADIWNAADEFQFVYRQLTGDSEVKARISSLSNTNTWAKAGVMVRESLAANSKNAYMAINPGGQLTFQRRTSTGASTTNTAGSVVSIPRWVRIRRSGSMLTGSVSSDGSSWSTVGSASISMASTVFVGLATTSHADGTIASSTYTNVSATASTSSVASLEIEDEGEDSEAMATMDESTGCSVVATSAHSTALYALLGLAGLSLIAVRRRRSGRS